MAETEGVQLDGESFVDKLSQLDRGLQVFLSGLAIGLTVLVVTIVQMCKAAFSEEGGYGDDDTSPAAAPAAAPKPPKPHATSQIRPISPNGKRASGTKSAKSGDLESGEGVETRCGTRGKSSRAKPPPKATASGGRKASLGTKAPLRKLLGSKKPSRTAPSFQPVSKASSDGVSELSSEDGDDHSDDHSEDHSNKHSSASSDESVTTGEAPLMTRLILQVVPAPQARLYPDCVLKCDARAQAPYGETIETELDIAHVLSLEELQAIVAQEWKEMVGGKMSSSMKMEYEDEDGDFVKVSRSTPIDELTSSAAIRLLRKGSGGGDRRR